MLVMSSLSLGQSDVPGHERPPAVARIPREGGERLGSRKEDRGAAQQPGEEDEEEHHHHHLQTKLNCFFFSYSKSAGKTDDVTQPQTVPDSVSVVASRSSLTARQAERAEVIILMSHRGRRVIAESSCHCFRP